MKKYDLSDLELEGMDYIWSHEEGVLFKDLAQYFITEQGKEWKRQSLRTFLLRLEEKGFLRIEQTKESYSLSGFAYIVDTNERRSFSQSYSIKGNCWCKSVRWFYI